MEHNLQLESAKECFLLWMGECLCFLFFRRLTACFQRFQEIKMKEIMTVCGPIKPENLGLTSMHEHVLCNGMFARQRYEDFLPPDSPVAADDPVRMEDLGVLRHAFILSKDAVMLTEENVMEKELESFKKTGGSALVDMSVPGIRYDIEATKRISEQSGVHIIGTTGLYSADSLSPEFLEMDIEAKTTFMLGEIQDGIEGTRIFPGHIKVALDVDNHPQELETVRAGARVSLESGLSVTVHQGMGTTAEAGQEIVRTMTEEGADFSRIILAHNDKNFVETNLDVLVHDPDSWKLNLEPALKLLDQGVNLSIDLFGHQWDAESLGMMNPTDWQGLAGLVGLIKKGYASQLVLGTDSFMKLQFKAYGGEGYSRLTEFVIPTLERLGVSSDSITAMIITNPIRLLSN
jgi:phosphotriesterase-related protein